MNPEWAAMVESLWSVMFSGSLSVVVGPRGTGKTQAVCEIAEAYEQTLGDPEWGESRCRYALAVELFQAIRATYGDSSSGSEKEAVERFVSPKLLVIDEIQEKSGTEWEGRVLTTIIDRRYAALKDTILLGNLKPTDVAKELGSSISSRAQETGQIYVCDWQSFRSPKQVEARA